MYKRGGGIKFLPRGASKYTPPPPSPEKCLLAKNGGGGGGAYIKFSPWVSLTLKSALVGPKMVGEGRWNTKVRFSLESVSLTRGCFFWGACFEQSREQIMVQSCNGQIAEQHGPRKTSTRGRRNVQRLSERCQKLSDNCPIKKLSFLSSVVSKMPRKTSKTSRISHLANP